MTTIIAFSLILSPSLALAAEEPGMTDAPKDQAMENTAEMVKEETTAQKAEDMNMKKEDHEAAIKKAKSKHDAAVKKARMTYTNALKAKKDKKKALAALKKTEAAAMTAYKKEKDTAMKAAIKKAMPVKKEMTKPVIKKVPMKAGMKK